MSDVFNSFVAPLLGHFHEPASEFVKDLVVELAVYPDAVLVDAARHLKRNHDRVTFPRLADCLKACEAASTARARAMPAPQQRRSSIEDWIDRQEHARALLKGAKGICREASRDQWFAGLWDFTADKGRLPVAAEIPALRRRAIETHRIVVESQGHKLLGGLATSMVGRYAKREQEACA